MPIYRYRQDLVNIARLSKLVPGALSFSAASPNYVDINAPSGSKPDLDAEMANQGFTFISTDPVDTPTAAVQVNLAVGETNTASNVGAGAQVFKAKTGVDLAFRTLTAGSGIQVQQNANDVSITATGGGGGEANTASNVGAGTGVFKQKTGVDLEFKTLVAGANVTLTPTASEITIAAPASAFDPRDVVAYDHFIVTTNTTERVGTMNWLVLVSGTGADQSVNSEAGHPGVIDYGAGTVAAGRAALYIGNTTFKNFLLNATQPQIDHEWLIKLDANALVAANMERFVVGWGDGFDAASGTEMSNGVYLEWNPTLNSTFQLVTAAASVRTRVNSTIAPSAATWYRIGFRMTYPGGVPTAEIFINGISRGTTTATIPTLAVGFGIRMDAGTSGVEPRYQADYVFIKQVTNKET